MVEKDGVSIHLNTVVLLCAYTMFPYQTADYTVCTARALIRLQITRDAQQVHLSHCSLPKQTTKGLQNLLFEEPDFVVPFEEGPWAVISVDEVITFLVANTILVKGSS